MPTTRPLLALTLALLAAALPRATAQNTPQQPARWSQDLLPADAARSVGSDAIALPQPEAAAEQQRYEVRLVASRTSGSGGLSVQLRDGGGELVTLFAAASGGSERSDTGAVELCWRVDGGRIEAGPGTRKATPGQPTKTEERPWVAVANDATFRLERLQWRAIEVAPKPTPKPAPVTKAAAPAPKKPTLLDRLAASDRWRGTLSGERGIVMDCTVVVLERSATTFVFRLENERGGWHRFECKVENGKLKVEKIVHTRAANGGARAVISDEKGQGRLVGDRFELDYTFTNRIRGSKNTVTGRVVVDFAPKR